MEHAGADADSVEEEKESMGWTIMTFVVFFDDILLDLVVILLHLRFLVFS